MDRRLDVSRKQYEKRQSELQLALLRIQRTYYQEGRRAVVVFEGWDAAGKGGAIRRLTEKLDPRGVRVHAIGAPTAQEQGKHYLWRFWQRLPEPGRIAIFDRSWYGRVLVERVEGFATKEQWSRAYDEINELERTLIDDGCRVIKLFIHITKGEQRERFVERLRDPYKRWKITRDDLRNRARWGDYRRAIHAMFDRTNTRAAPWVAVEGNHKWYARVAVLEAVVEALSAGVKVRTPKVKRQFLEEAAAALGTELDL
jgi:polyphosphate kinase 2 (PPK2 family)